MLQKPAKLKHSFTRKSSATLSVLFTQPTKQSVVSVMTCRHVGCFRFLETEKLQKQKKPFGQKLQLMQHPNVTTCQKTLKSKLRHHVYIQTKRNVSKASHLFTKLMKLHVDRNLSVQKVRSPPKLFPNISKVRKPHKTAQKCMSTSGLKAIP